MRAYDDARFGLAKIVAHQNPTGALNGTVGATVLGVFPQGSAAIEISRIGISFTVGGTGALRQLLIGTATPSNGTLGTIGYVGTLTLGTQANLTAKVFYLLGTKPVVNGLDAVIVAHQGTDAAVYNIQAQVWGTESFTNL